MKYVVESKIYDHCTHTLIRPFEDGDKDDSYGNSTEKFDYYYDVVENLKTAKRLVNVYNAFY